MNTGRVQVSWAIVGELGPMPERAGSLEIGMDDVLTGKNRQAHTAVGTALSRAVGDLLAELVKELVRDIK